MVPCEACKGRKIYLRKLTLKERVELSQIQRGKYEREQTIARHVPIGAAYADKNYWDALDPEAFATLAAQYPAACKKCYGFGAQPCTHCDSKGFQMKKERPSDGEAELVTEICSTCNGSGGRICKTCNATGLLRPCRRCNGCGVMHKAATKKRPAVTERCSSCSGMGRR